MHGRIVSIPEELPEGLRPSHPKMRRLINALEKLGINGSDIVVELYRVNSPGHVESASAIQLTHSPTGWQASAYRYFDRVENMMLASALLYAAISGMVEERTFGAMEVIRK